LLHLARGYSGITARSNSRIGRAPAERSFAL
jgi:hypothetical protein